MLNLWALFWVSSCRNENMTMRYFESIVEQNDCVFEFNQNPKVSVTLSAYTNLISIINGCSLDFYITID